MKLLLHTCCAPCSSAIIEALLKEGVRPTVYYCNPNIYPDEEYFKRKDECSRYAAECGLDMVDDDYDHAAWLSAVAGMENEPERGARCAECFRYRLLRSARYALENGFDTLATTLASSRWKSLDQINAAGQWAVDQALAQVRGLDAASVAGSVASGTLAASAADSGASDVAPLQWWPRNWRKGGLQERRNALIKEKGFYNQLYCGCEFSRLAMERKTEAHPIENPAKNQ